MDEWKREPAGDAAAGKDNAGEPPVQMKLPQKKELLLIVVVLVGITALLWPQKEEFTAENRETAAIQEKTVLENTRQQLAAEVQQILSGISGIGRVEVSLTLDSDGMREYAFNQAEESRESSEAASGSGGDRTEKTVSQSWDVAVSGGAPLLVENHYPQVAGVLVVAEGAKDAVMQQKICDAVAVLLDISPHRVRVLAGEEESNP